MFMTNSFVRHRGTHLRAEGLTPLLGEIAPKTFGYEASVIVPFLLLARNFKDEREAQETVERLVEALWLDEDTGSIVESLNALAESSGIGKVAEKGSVKLVLNKEKIEGLKKLGKDLASKIRELFEEPYTPEKLVWLSMVVVPKSEVSEDDLVVEV